MRIHWIKRKMIDDVFDTRLGRPISSSSSGARGRMERVVVDQDGGV